MTRSAPDSRCGESRGTRMLGSCVTLNQSIHLSGKHSCHLLNHALQTLKNELSEGLPWELRWERICLQYGRPGFDPWVGKILWRRAWQPTLVFLPGEFHRQRSLVGYSPWGHKESDTTEQLTLPSKCCVTLGHESPLSGPQFHPLKNAHLGWTLFQVVQLQLL